MEVIVDGTGCPSEPCAVTIGAYDGVHVGHQAVIARTHDEAARRGARTAVVTFDRHPASVVRPDSAPKLLSTLEQKLELLAELGVDYAYVVHFDEERSRESAEGFVQDVLVDCLHARCVVVGADFHFGHGRSGNVALLQRLGAHLGFDTVGLDLLTVSEDGQPTVSSTAIRAALGRGDVEAASAMLGRQPELRGVVAHGDKRGRTLGFPTANVAVPADLLVPGDGIYACWYERPDGSRHPAAVNVGRRPTFYDDAPVSLVEAFVLDFEGDLYGEAARLHFVRRLRPEVRFDSVEALVAQMNDDVVEARQVLGLDEAVPEVGAPGAPR